MLGPEMIAMPQIYERQWQGFYVPPCPKGSPLGFRIFMHMAEVRRTDTRCMMAKVRRVEEMLAKSCGEPLVEHCLAVARLCLLKARDAGWPKPMQEAAYLSGLLHDVGKALPGFQVHLHAKVDPLLEGYDAELSRSTVMHHEASWAAARLMLPDSAKLVCRPVGRGEGTSSEVLSAVLTAVYWHHSQPSRWVDGVLTPARRSVSEVLPPADLSARTSCGLALAELFREASEDPCLCDLPEARALWAGVPALLGNNGEDTTGIPPLVPLSGKSDGIVKFADYTTMALRSVLIASDREISSGMLVHSCSAAAVPPLRKPEEYDQVRWDRQEAFVDAMIEGWEAWENQPVVVNAPAGFGKTALGVSVASRLGGQVFWVCPRNEVATSVYHSILKELDAVGSTRSVELFLGGRQKAHRGCDNDFQSSIVVTNIDNLLKGTCDNRASAGHMWPALSSTVVFDEYHELPNTGGLLYYFLTFMNARTRLMASARTVLLSATGHSVPSCLWDSAQVSTRHLPERYKHAPAAHTKPYHVGVCRDPSTVVLGPGSVSIFNSVANAQGVARRHGVTSTICVHSGFCDEDYKDLMDFLEKEFGKGGARSAVVSSAPVLQAAKDISFIDMYESVSSAENTIQRLGRDNRWGQESSARFTIIVPEDKSPKTEHWNPRSEDSARALQVGKPLGSAWKKEVLRFIGDGGKVLTLDEVYQWYNSFCEVHASDILASYSEGSGGRELKKSAEEAGKVYPTKVVGSKGQHYERSGAEGNLRNPEAAYFVAPLCYQAGAADGGGGDFDDQVVLPLAEEQLADLCERDQWTAKGLLAATSRMTALGKLPDLAASLRGWAAPHCSKGGKSMDRQYPLADWRRLARKETTPYPTEQWVYQRYSDPCLRSTGVLGLGLEKRAAGKETWE